jgi:uncharacterized membrane protein YfcA
MGAMEQWLVLLLLGLAIGIISGMLGIGGGILVIPALVFFFSFPHRKAVGTSLAMLLPPIGIFALLKYWHEDHNNVDFKAALLLAAGFAIGGYLGGAIANSRIVSENDRWLRILFALFLLYVAGNMLFRSENRVQAALKTAVLIVGYGIIYGGARLLARRLERRLELPEAYRARLAAPLEPDYEI